MSTKVKAILFVVVELILLFFAVMGWHYTDYAESKFWWNAWIVIALLSMVGFISLIFWFFKRKNDW